MMYRPSFSSASDGPSSLLPAAALLGLCAVLLGCSAEPEEPAVRVRLASLGTTGNCQAQGHGSDNDNGSGVKNGHCREVGSGGSTGTGGTTGDGGSADPGSGGTADPGHGADPGDGADPGGGLSGGISIVDRDGNPIPFDPEGTQLVVDTRRGGEWEGALDVSLALEARPRLDVVLVADNSGGMRRDVERLKLALGEFSGMLLGSAGADRVGLVRVSTEARTLQGLTHDGELMQGAIDSLFVSNGWTALWDGVRIANQMLAEGQFDPSDEGLTCFSGAYPVIVAMTDGVDNNSAGQNNTRYPGDGIDTHFEDLVDLHAGSRRTTINTVGIGRRIDEASLHQLALGSGGIYRHVDDFAELLGALRTTSQQLRAMIPVCFRPAHCSHDEVRVQVTLEHEGETHTAEFVTILQPSCATED